MIMATLSTYEPNRKEHIRIEVIRSISNWSQVSIGVLMASVLVTLGAVAIIPFSREKEEKLEKTDAAFLPSYPGAEKAFDNKAQAWFVFGCVVATFLAIIVLLGHTVPVFYGMRSESTHSIASLPCMLSSCRCPHGQDV
jgi:hypothetical protein